MSNDGRYALVVIYLLGSPMSPYYKACVSASPSPPARDFCGVFFSLHERTTPHSGKWVERAYAYNLTKNGTFAPLNQPANACIGASTLEANACNTQWKLSVREKRLWAGDIHADLTWAQTGEMPPVAGIPNAHAGEDATHTWACVAPVCDAQGILLLPGGETIAFSGSGYHDHNWGRLPLTDTDLWYWGRAPLVCDDNRIRHAVFYHVLQKADGENRQASQTAWLTFTEGGEPDNQPVLFRDNLPRLLQPTRNRYGFTHHTRLLLAQNVRGDSEQWRIALHPERGVLSDGPFYRRLPVSITAKQTTEGRGAWSGKGEGIAEVLRPSRLLGPIASRAMWSRIRRRA